MTEVYDELGNRYVIPKYCISKPKNLQQDEDDVDQEPHVDSTTQLLLREHFSSENLERVQRSVVPSTKAGGTPLTFKVRLSTVSKDIKVSMTIKDRVGDLKRKLQDDHNVEARRITMLYSGKVLHNGTLLKDLEVPKGFVIQAVVT